MHHFKVIALTHRSVGLELIGKFHVANEAVANTFGPHLAELGVSELVYLNTCNRVEFILFCKASKSHAHGQFFQRCFAHLGADELLKASTEARIYEGLDAIRHLFHVASSMDSMVVGEREIITQVRQGFELCRRAGLTADYTALAVKKAIECAKKVYAETEIATKPVSVVNLGYKRLMGEQLHPKQRLLLVGAGTSMAAMAGNLKAQAFEHVAVVNRTIEKAEALAQSLGGKAFQLKCLSEQWQHADVVVTCTAAGKALITNALMASAFAKNPQPKIVLDLALPADVEAVEFERYNITYIGLESLKAEAAANLKHREKQIFRCEELVEEKLAEFDVEFKTRQLEKAMASVPSLMAEIKTTAIEKRFASKIASMNEQQKATLLEVVDFLEKKYRAVPMKMAKQVVLGLDLKNGLID